MIEVAQTMNGRYWHWRVTVGTHTAASNDYAHQDDYVPRSREKAIKKARRIEKVMEFELDWQNVGDDE